MFRTFTLIWSFFNLQLLKLVMAIPVDNSVVGVPEVECGPESIEVTFLIRNPFNGKLFVKGRYGESDCQNEQIGRTFTGITLAFGTCGVQRLRSLNPMGVFATTTVVVSFHPLFVTKVDRAYRIQCFYMEAQKPVSQPIQVSELTTAFRAQNVPMPVCRYEVLEGGPTGQPVEFAVIGQQIYHKWTCESETVDTFCMIVHSCIVEDGRGTNTVQMLDKNGCALDKYVLNNLEYPTDLSAGQEAHVFKYADKSSLFFKCQITVSLKEGHAECPRPRCAEPNRRGFRELNTLDAFGTESRPMVVLQQRMPDNIVGFCLNAAVVFAVACLYIVVTLVLILATTVQSIRYKATRIRSTPAKIGISHLA